MALLERNKHIKADLIEKGLLKIDISMIDNVHQISTSFIISFPEKMIKHAEADFKRAPYLGVCKLMSKKMDNLKGIKLDHGFTQKVVNAIGGGKGCHHLVDQTLEMAKSLSQFIDKAYNIPINDLLDNAPLLREKVLDVYPEAKNMCWAYNLDNNHLFTKDIKCGLKGDLII